MLRSQTVNTIHDVHAQGKSVQEIAQELSISRTTVRKYLKHPEAVIPKSRPPRLSKLDPYKEQIKKWVMEDHCTNCEVLFERLQKLSYTGGISILKEYVRPLRPAVAGHAPVQRYETKPGEQVQFDWGEFVYEHEGKTHKFYGFVAILGYSRMRFVTFVKRCDTPTLIRCLMEAFEYFGGLTKVALTDRMKSVLLEMVENKPRWNPRFADAHGFHRGCSARLQAVHTTNERQSGTHSESCEDELMGWDHLHGSRRSQSPGAWLVRAHQCSCPSHYACAPSRSSGRGEVAALATRLCLGALCH